jgi:ABC-type branched-subunit amino acid transport system substrate-binding protein
VIAAPASLDSDWVRDPNLIALGAPYQIQMINAADYVVNTLGDKGKVFCSFIQDDSYGQAGQAGIDFAGASLGYTMKTTVKYTAGATDFTAQVQQLKANKCDVVFLVSTPDVTGAAFAKAVQLQFAPQWIGQSPSYIGALAASPLAPYLEAHYLVVSEGPEWGDRSVKGMADMLDRLTQFDPSQKPDYFFAFGYYQAWAVDQILEKAVALGDLSHAGIMAAMAQVGTLKFDGLAGDYNYGTGAADRNPPRVNAIFKVNPAKPGGLELVKPGISTALAQSFKFS